MRVRKKVLRKTREVTAAAMHIRLNGEDYETPSRSVSQLIEEVLGERPRDGVAVALANVVLRRSEWPTQAICEGDRVEIIRAVGGG